MATDRIRFTKWWGLRMFFVWRWRLGYWDWYALRSVLRVGGWR